MSWKFFTSAGQEKRTLVASAPNLLSLVYDNRLSSDTSAGLGWDTGAIIPGNPGDDLIISVDSRFGTASLPQMRFNNDSGVNYARTVVDNGVSQFNNLNQIDLDNLSDAEDDTTASFSSAWEVTIRNYAGTDFYKNLTWVGGSVGRPSAAHGIGLWKNTVAITRFAFFPSAGVVKTGSRLTIWRRSVS